jgi:hypothetical protein
MNHSEEHLDSQFFGQAYSMHAIASQQKNASGKNRLTVRPLQGNSRPRWDLGLIDGQAGFRGA